MNSKVFLILFTLLISTHCAYSAAATAAGKSALLDGEASEAHRLLPASGTLSTTLVAVAPAPSAAAGFSAIAALPLAAAATAAPLPTPATAAASSSALAALIAAPPSATAASAGVSEGGSKTTAHLKHVRLGFAPTAAAGEPAYIREQRQLIMERSFTIDAIALFSSNDLIGTGIRTLTASNWSHCGLRLRDERGGLYCFESTGSPEEILKQRMLPQVQIHTWEEVVKGYSGDVGFRTITMDDGYWDKARTGDFTNWVLEILGTPYEKNISSLLNAIRSTNTSEAPTSVFCSELVAMALIKYGLLPGAGQDNYKLPDNFLPRDFSGSQYLPWLHAKLSKEQMAKSQPTTKCPSCTIL